MTKTTKQVTWTGKNGEVTLDIIVTRGVEKTTENTNADGHSIAIDRKNIIETTDLVFTAGSNTITGLRDNSILAQAKGFPMVLENGGDINICIGDNSVADKIRAAITDATAEAEQDVDFSEVLKNRAELDEYENNYNRVRQAMSY